MKLVIDPSWRTLDAGCGSGPKRPARGFSAYCDIIKPGPGVILPEPYFCTPLEDLSCFKDKEFDFVRAHHCLEHVIDPDKACAEIIRVGKRGIISTPPAHACIMFGRADHRWLVFHDRDRLLFLEKWHRSLGIPRSVTQCQLNQNFIWEGSFRWQTVHVHTPVFAGVRT